MLISEQIKLILNRTYQFKLFICYLNCQLLRTENVILSTEHRKLTKSTFISNINYVHANTI